MDLYVDPAFPRYTWQELLDYVKAHDFDFSYAAFRDWQRKGLIAEAAQDHRWTEGRAGSGPGRWSENQRGLLVELLRLRDEQRQAGWKVTGRAKGDVSGLGNVVVWQWLYFDGIVALPQARKALDTWIRPQLDGVHGQLRSFDRLYRDARKTVRQLAGPGASGASVTEAAKRLANVYFTADFDDLALTSLMSSLHIVIDPADTGRTFGPPDWAVTVDGVTWAFAAEFLAAVAVIRRPDVLIDDDWTFGQAIARRAWAEYCHDWERRRHDLADDPIFASETPDFGLQARSASHTVLYLLGSRLMERPESN